MSKNKKMFFMSILFIFLIVIVGFTYGFVVTKIIGNSSSKKMSFISKKSSVTYREISNTSSGETISPGYEYIKVFTVTNTGNSDVKFHIYLDEVQNNFVRTQDIAYTLYKKSGNNTVDINNLDDIEIIANGVFPITNQYIKTNEVIDNINDVYTYVLKINYNISTEDQSNDNGHIFGFKIQLHTALSNPYKTNTLAYEIYNNVIVGTLENKTEFVSNFDLDDFLSNISSTIDRIFSNSLDDYGMSYYFRGNPIDNYVEFAGMCFRIVRIEGDGSVKLILVSELSCNETNLSNSSGFITYGDRGVVGGIVNASYGYKLQSTTYVNDYIDAAEYGEYSARTRLNEWLERKLSSDEIKLLKNDKWCIGDLKNGYSEDDNSSVIGNVSNLIESNTPFNYFASTKYYLINKPSFKCSNTGMKDEIDINKIGLLTLDEAIFSGLGFNSNSNFLNVNALGKYWWLLSTSNYNSGNKIVYNFVVNDSGQLWSASVGNDSVGLHPSITFLSDVKVSDGNGTIESPYVVR